MGTIVAQMYFPARHNADAHTCDGAPMPEGFRRFLSYYLSQASDR
jgi:hypothetical protein